MFRYFFLSSSVIESLFKEPILLLFESFNWTPWIFGNGVTRDNYHKNTIIHCSKLICLPVENNGSIALILFCAQEMSLSAIEKVSIVRYPRFFSSAVSQIYVMTIRHCFYSRMCKLLTCDKISLGRPDLAKNWTASKPVTTLGWLLLADWNNCL